MAKDPIEGETVATRKAAENVSKMLGCSGAHQVEGGWQPCESPDALRILINEGKAGYLRWQARQGKAIVTRVQSEDLKKRKKKKPKRKKRRNTIPKDWEDLAERPRPVDGIYTSIPPM